MFGGCGNIKIKKIKTKSQEWQNGERNKGKSTIYVKHYSQGYAQIKCGGNKRYNPVFHKVSNSRNVIAQTIYKITDLLILIEDRKSTRLNSSHQIISYAVFCLKKKKPN